VEGGSEPRVTNAALLTIVRSSQAEVSGCDVVQALVVARVIVVIHEVHDLSCKLTGQVVVLQQKLPFMV